MSAIDDQELLDRIRAAYAGESLRVPLAAIQRGRRTAHHWRVAVAGVCAGIAAVGGGVYLIGGPAAPTGGLSTVDATCATQVVQLTRDAHGLPPQERGQLPTMRLDFTIGADRVIMYATPHALITCAAPDGAAAATLWVVPDGQTLPPSKLQPLVSQSIDPRLSWIGGTVPDDTRQIEVELPSGRRLTGVTNGRVFLAAWTGEAAAPIRIRATAADSNVVTWGPID